MDTFVDPTTGAYVASNNDLARDPARGLANAVYLRLMTPLGSYWGNAELGSRLHELVRHKAVVNVSLIAEQYARLALQPLLKDGRAQSIDITTEIRPMDDGSRGLLMRVEVTDAAGRGQTFSYHVPVA